MPKNVMLAVHCKNSEAVELAAPLRSYIQLHYGDHQASDSADDLETVASLRRDVINQIGALPQLKEKMAKYYAILSTLESRFPIAKGAGNVEVAFKWYDAFQSKKAAEQYNIHFEKAAVLFNLGAISSQIGLQADRSTEDGIKEAAKRFQDAAGYYALLKDRDALKVDTPRPVDVTSECAAMLERLMLAQAQECFYEKARKDNKSPGIIARLAQQVSAYYGDVYRKLQQAPLNQHFDRAWVAHVGCKSSMYAVEALIRSAEQVSAEDDMQGCGKALARLKDAFNVLQTAKREAKQSSKDLQEGVSTMDEDVTQRYNRLMRENETVYLQRVPDPATLPAVQGVSLVKATPVEGLGTAPGADKLFNGVVPDTSAKAMSRYTDLVDGVVRGAMDKLEAASDEARLRLREWELPECLDCLSAGTCASLPDGLRSELEALEGCGGAQHLTDLAQQLRELRRVAESELGQVQEQLDREAAEDEQLRGRFSTRWTRPPSAALSRPLCDKLAGYKANLAAAGESDARLFQKLDGNAPGLAGLSLEAACSQMPRLQAPMLAVGDMEPPLIVNTLRAALDMVAQLSNQRAALEEAIKEEKGKDDILSRLMSSGEDHEALFQQELGKYQPLLAEVDANVSKQAEVLAIIDKNQSAFKITFGYQEWRKACESSSAGLKAQLAVYRELRDNLSEGARFYSALQDAVRTLSQQCGDYCLTRRIQRDDLLGEFQRERENQAETERRAQQAMAQLAVESRPPPHQQQPAYQPAQQHMPPPGSAYPGQMPPPPPTGAHYPPSAYPFTAPQHPQQHMPPPAAMPVYPPHQGPTYSYQQHGAPAAPPAAYPYQAPSAPAAYGGQPQYYQNPSAGYQQQPYQQAPQQAPQQQPQQQGGAPAQHNPLWGK